LGLLLQPVPLGDVDGLRLLEFDQQHARAGVIESVAFELRHDLALPHDVVGAKLDLLLRLSEILEEAVEVYSGHAGTFQSVTMPSTVMM
jgi:hypothetical protein